MLIYLIKRGEREEEYGRTWHKIEREREREREMI